MRLLHRSQVSLESARNLASALSKACTWLQATCGAIYGVVPFTSRRSCGLACGLVSAGGAIGGVMNQGIFFLNTEAVGPYCKPLQGLTLSIFKSLGSMVSVAWSCIVMTMISPPSMYVQQLHHFFDVHTNTDHDNPFPVSQKSARSLKGLYKVSCVGQLNHMEVTHGMHAYACASW